MQVAKHAYVHFPLCRVKCSYCAFNITTSDNPVWRTQWVSRVLSSFDAQQPVRGRLETLYLGIES